MVVAINLCGLELESTALGRNLAPNPSLQIGGLADGQARRHLRFFNVRCRTPRTCHSR
jgi:hypothetical protein